MPAPLHYYSGAVRGPVIRLYSWRTIPPAPQKWIYRRTMTTLPEADDISRLWAGMIDGVVTVQGVPARRRVVALESKGLMPRLHAYSDPVTGKFRLYPLVAGPRKYLVAAQDANVRFNVVAYDGVKPVPWEDEE